MLNHFMSKLSRKLIFGNNRTRAYQKDVFNRDFDNKLVDLWIDSFEEIDGDIKVVGWCVDSKYKLPAQRISLNEQGYSYEVGSVRRLYRSDVARKKAAFCDVLGFEIIYAKPKMNSSLDIVITSVEGSNIKLNFTSSYKQQLIRRIKRKLCSIF